MSVPVFEIIDSVEPTDEAIAALARLLLASVDDDPIKKPADVASVNRQSELSISPGRNQDK